MNVSKDVENIKIRKALINEIRTEIKEIQVSLQIIKNNTSLDEPNDFNGDFIRDNDIMLSVDMLGENVKTLRRFLNIFRNS
jgi:hypothetical protein